MVPAVGFGSGDHSFNSGLQLGQADGQGGGAEGSYGSKKRSTSSGRAPS